MRTLALAGVVGLALASLTAACTGGSTPDLDVPGTQVDALAPELNTFITDSLQIDELGGGPGDANLFADLDPADGSDSVNLPLGGPDAFIDWEDLGWDLANHRLMDTDDPATGRDLTAFPGSNECVGPANVLSKMDLTYVASANNQAFAYLAVQRSANNGDAGYYWLFTRLEPRQVLNEYPCRRDMERLVYDISVGDVLIKGHFKPSADPLLEVFQATSAVNNVGAVDAINFLSPIWALSPDGVAAVAVNSTVTAPGTFGAEGIKTMAGDNLDTELFAEAAVPLWVFTGQTGNVCDATFYGSVITRSSGSGGTTPDLKDLAGPALFNFGTATAEAELLPTCTNQFGYQLTEAIGADGQSMTDPGCHWFFSDGTESFECGDPTFREAPLGTLTATLVVTDPVSGCEADVTPDSVEVYAPLGVTPLLTPTCALSYDYEVVEVHGGSGDYGYEWTFPAGTPGVSNVPSGSVSVPQGDVDYGATLRVTDLRDDLPGCFVDANATTRPYAPVEVVLTPDVSEKTCPAFPDDTVTFTATAAGGDGVYSYLWTGGDCVGPVCTVDPDDSDFCPTGNVSVRVDDGTTLCPYADSESFTWRKETTVTVTADN